MPTVGKQKCLENTVVVGMLRCTMTIGDQKMVITELSAASGGAHLLNRAHRKKHW